ncbi:MAG: hypothetical protein R2699_18490 [Acidimicrobiales bacterium]|nr:hypothetical protein [Acidimicrobiales bacterium]MCB1248694.1 hypothetical protein [Acidimicrobiales bacterium]
MERHIHPSARKHGVSDEDIVHAIDHALVIEAYEDDVRLLYVGPDSAANLLEVVTVVDQGDDELVIHTMRMQAKYEPLLRGLGEPDE